MKKISLILFFATFAVISVYAQTASNVHKQTFLYSEKNGQKLYLDRYEVPSDTNANPKPCLIFMFGGGFVSGTRDEPRYIPYFNHFAERGYCVVSIDYRLGFKGYKPGPEDGPVEMLNHFAYTIGIAVEDLFDATTFLVERAEEWKIDPEMVVATGSSAGAVSVLQGEYYISNGHELAGKLPNGFNYAGIVGFAGAIFTVGDLTWPSVPCPIQMFHGDADSNVPYDKVTELGVGFYGSEYISTTLDSLPAPYYFYSETDAAHEIAVDAMVDNLDDIDFFLDQMVENKEPYQINTVLKVIGRPVKNKNFTILDYIKSNFGS